MSPRYCREVPEVFQGKSRIEISKFGYMCTFTLNLTDGLTVHISHVVAMLSIVKTSSFLARIRCATKKNYVRELHGSCHDSGTRVTTTDVASGRDIACQTLGI